MSYKDVNCISDTKIARGQLTRDPNLLFGLKKLISTRYSQIEPVLIFDVSPGFCRMLSGLLGVRYALALPSHYVDATGDIILKLYR